MFVFVSIDKCKLHLLLALKYHALSALTLINYSYRIISGWVAKTGSNLVKVAFVIIEISNTKCELRQNRALGKCLN